MAGLSSLSRDAITARGAYSRSDTTSYYEYVCSTPQALQYLAYGEASFVAQRPGWFPADAFSRVVRWLLVTGVAPLPYGDGLEVAPVDHSRIHSRVDLEGVEEVGEADEAAAVAAMVDAGGSAADRPVLEGDGNWFYTSPANNDNEAVILEMIVAHEPWRGEGGVGLSTVLYAWFVNMRETVARYGPLTDAMIEYARVPVLSVVSHNLSASDTTIMRNEAVLDSMRTPPEGVARGRPPHLAFASAGTGGAVVRFPPGMPTHSSVYSILTAACEAPSQPDRATLLLVADALTRYCARVIDDGLVAGEKGKRRARPPVFSPAQIDVAPDRPRKRVSQPLEDTPLDNREHAEK